MRYHPALYQNYRQAARDDVLPLSKPIIGRDGTEITKLPIGKGTKIILSIAAYNRCELCIPIFWFSQRLKTSGRNKEVWGEDAHEYKPERWLENGQGKKGPTLGVYGNL